MPEPTTDPNMAPIRRVAMHALLGGALITLLKFIAFWLTDSVAVLSDALESIINIAAAGALLLSIWYSNRPADRRHPYGHGKIEFMVVGLEGWLILMAGVLIGYTAIVRLVWPVHPQNIGWGMALLGLIAILSAALAGYVWHAGRKYNSAPLEADGRHLITDVLSTAAVFIGLGLVETTGFSRLDPLVAILMACIILYMSWRLLWRSFHGLMDHSDPKDEKAIDEILRDEVKQGQIRGYHKVRHRHTGAFHWVDMHLHVDGGLSVEEGHVLASRIEGRIERRLGRANATAHLEPYQEQAQATPTMQGDAPTSEKVGAPLPNSGTQTPQDDAEDAPLELADQSPMPEGDDKQADEGESEPASGSALPREPEADEPDDGRSYPVDDEQEKPRD